MAMTASEIEQLIRASIPDADVAIRDLAGDGDHYAALGGRVGGELHALQLETAVPQAEKKQ